MREYLIFSEESIDTELTGEGAIVLKVTDASGSILDGVTFNIPINPEEAFVLSRELMDKLYLQQFHKGSAPQIIKRNSGRYPWDKIEKEGFCSVCAIEKGSPTCEKCKHKEEKQDE